jgi:antitoxin (DNA-binding transcriptional repressor) of toxin-antitoxin stability system
MEYVTLQEISLHAPQILHKAAQGEEIIVTENDKPLAKISSAAEDPYFYFGCAKGEIFMSDDFDEIPEDFKDYI